MAQPFLETGQRCLFVLGFDINHSVRRQPRRGQTRAEQILIAHTPEDLPRHPRHDARREQGSGRTVQGTVPGAGNLVQGSQREAPAKQTRIHLGQPKGQNPGHAAVRRLKPADFFAQKIDGGQ